MKAMRLILPIASLLVAFVATSFATQEMAKKEKKACTVCHEKGKATKENPLLNAAGKQYKEKGTLPK
jgi:hypothetical protein